MQVGALQVGGYTEEAGPDRVILYRIVSMEKYKARRRCLKGVKVTQCYKNTAAHFKLTSVWLDVPADSVIEVSTSSFAPEVPQILTLAVLKPDLVWGSGTQHSQPCWVLRTIKGTCPIEDTHFCASLGKLCSEDRDQKKESCVQRTVLKMGFTQPKLHIILFSNLEQERPTLDLTLDMAGDI